MKDKLTADRARPAQACPSPLVPLKQIPCLNLFLIACEFVAPAVGNDPVAAGLKGLQVVGTPEPKNSGASGVGLLTTTGTPLVFTRFMTPRMEMARKLADPSSGLR